MSEKHEHIVRPRLFYCFVDFGHETSWPVYLMPSRDVAWLLTLSYHVWLAAPGRAARGTPLRETPTSGWNRTWEGGT